MALFPKTPGVYIEEISTLPPSVASVPTSVPVFIGYTEKAEMNGAQLSFPTRPVRIESLLQFEEFFGGSYDETFDVTLTGAAVTIAVSKATSATKDFRLYYNMRMYFANGGGPCYIISTGKYALASINNGDDLIAAIPKAEQVDEITMVVIPDAMSTNIDNAERRNVYNAALAHCAKMQDRFALLDVQVNHTAPDTIDNDADLFRNNAVGANYLNYGAAYYPSFKPGFGFSYQDAATDIAASNVNLPANVKLFNGKTLDVVNNGINGVVEVDFAGYTGNGNPDDILRINGYDLDLNTNDSTTLMKAAIDSTGFTASLYTATVAGTKLVITTKNPGTLTVAALDSGSELPIGPPAVAVTTVGILPDKVLYNQIKAQIAEFPIELYPSATMAGIYCAVDSNRGIWKAPANTGVTLVDKLNRVVKDSDQGDLNVDAGSGKSINAIRTFDGRGTLVWGARTLEGNSNEWRYINVRRTFIFIEDSCKKASEFVVFEPNDANTWTRVKSMIESFLTNLWRDGALAGAKPEHAFFVKVGLGQTMTAQDILEGRLIVQVGIAVVRPAEFIILQFMHKLQEA
jgi:phage tail sheath protein FI